MNLLPIWVQIFTNFVSKIKKHLREYIAALDLTGAVKDAS